MRDTKARTVNRRRRVPVTRMPGASRAGLRKASRDLEARRDDLPDIGWFLIGGGGVSPVVGVIVGQDLIGLTCGLVLVMTGAYVNRG